MKIFKAKQRGLLIVCCIVFITAIASLVFAKPSFEVANKKEPTVTNTTIAPATQDRGKNVIISSKVTDVSGVSYVKAEIKNGAGTVVATVNLYDDGVHNDGTAGDSFFASSWMIPATFSAGNYGVFIVASDTLGYIYANAVADANLTVTIPACVPSKTCADYPGQCGTTLFNGCANVLDCSGSCVAPKICCSGSCQNPVCLNNGNCNDSNSCTTDICNNPGNCSASCSNNPIVACINGDGCCPAGCAGIDTDCACVPTCGTGPNCRIVALANASVTAAVCCGVGESCYQCNAGYTWDGAACVAVCVDTCASLGYECGTQTVCGAATNCGSCVAPKTCSAVTGKCVTVSALTAEITDPNDGANFTQGDWIDFRGFALGGTPNYTYEWSSDKDGVFSNNQWGGTNALSANTHTITLTVTDSDGTTASNSIIVVVQPAGTLTAQIQMWQTEFVLGDTIWFGVNVSGGTAPYTFVWNNGAADFATVQWPSVDLTATPWATGTYTITVTVTDSVGNIVTDTIDIKIVEMTANIQPRDGDHFIYSDPVWFSAFVFGGTAPYTFSWISDLDGVIGNVDWFDRDDLQQGVHIITVTITDSSGIPITITKTFRIQIDPPPALSVTIDNPPNNSTFNQGDTISFEGTETGGVWPYIFTWTSSLDGVVYTNNTNPDFTKNNLSVGAHTITLKATDNSGQTATDSITVVINSPSPLVAVINSPNNGDTFFRIDDFIEFDGSANGGVSPYTYKWVSDKDGDITPVTGPTDKFSKNNLSVNAHTITLTVTDGVGATATDNVNITVNANCVDNNVKDATKYSAKETFLIADSNWRDVLSLAPIAIWNGGGTINKNPALIYHHETATAFDADSTIHFMQIYDPSHLTTIGSIPANLNNLFIAAEPVGAGINSVNISNINPSDYFSYWSSYDSLVVVDYNNYKSGLMASVFASHKNSPIIFVNSANLATYQPLINGKKVYAVGALDAATQTYIDGNASCQVKYTLEELQKWYIAETGSDKLILINPNDLNIKFSYSFFPDKSGFFDDMFGKMSLSAPFLAAAKQEVISFSELSDPGSNDGCGANAAITANIAAADADSLNAINNLFSIQPKYLTIIAAPQAIPDSEYNSCLGIIQFRNSKDWRYGSLNNSTYDLKTGRIYGITISDASSYVNRSIFFDYLISQIYGGNYSGISIGHSFASDEGSAKSIQQKTSASGYNSICFVWSAGYAPCVQNISPPVFNYQNKRFITFGDHGSYNQWASTLFSDDIPWLDLPYVAADACSTNNYWQFQNGYTFSANMIRKGATAYWGATGISTVSYPSDYEVKLKGLTESDSNTITLGDAHDIHYTSLLLGDPTLQLKLKQVSW